MVCNSEIKKHDLFLQIISEHEQCLSRIELAITIAQKKDILDWLWTEIENKHHFKEESLIYPVLAQKKKLTEGGPFCTLYFDEHIVNRPSDKVKALIQKEPSWQSHQLIYKENQSPLSIPLEEHRSLRELLVYLIENQKNISDQQFLKIYDNYVNLLKHHNTKEEKCFFRVCEICLSQIELDEIFSKWLTFSE